MANEFEQELRAVPKSATFATPSPERRTFAVCNERVGMGVTRGTGYANRTLRSLCKVCGRNECRKSNAIAIPTAICTRWRHCKDAGGGHSPTAVHARRVSRDPPLHNSSTKQRWGPSAENA